ncbi:MAG: ATP-binding protein [Myxococcota bacterium]
MRGHLTSVLGLGTLLAGLTALMASTQSGDTKLHSELQELIRTFKLVLSEHDRHVFEAWNGSTLHYDELVKDLRLARRLEQRLGPKMRTAEEREHFARLQRALRALEFEQELFKSKSSVLRNSLQYLPRLAHGLLQGLTTEEGRGVRDVLDDVVLGTFEFVTTPQAENADRIEERLLQIETRGGQFKRLAQHARHVIAFTEANRNHVAQLTNGEATRRLDELSKLLENQFTREAERAHLARRVLYGVALLLLCWLVLTLFQLRHRGLTLKRTLANLQLLNDRLEEKVAERTGQLEQTNGELKMRMEELKQTQEKLIFADRMAAMGQLAAGVAHEVNNPLGFVISNIDFALGELTEHIAVDPRSAAPESAAQELLDALKDARTGALRVANIVRGLKAFARIDEGHHEAVDVRQALDQAIQFANHEIRHRAQLIRDYHEVPRIEGNEAKLTQVFLNLLINATQAIAEAKEKSHQIRVTTRLSPMGQVVVQVQDTGCGMSPEVQKQLFNPFFTTKPVGTGTGLGLSICHGIISGMGGAISVESASGEGSTFTIALPVNPAMTYASERSS